MTDFVVANYPTQACHPEVTGLTGGRWSGESEARHGAAAREEGLRGRRTARQARPTRNWRASRGNPFYDLPRRRLGSGDSLLSAVLPPSTRYTQCDQGCSNET